jgi:hypothetical protein
MDEAEHEVAMDEEQLQVIHGEEDLHESDEQG